MMPSYFKLHDNIKSSYSNICQVGSNFAEMGILDHRSLQRHHLQEAKKQFSSDSTV